MFVKITMSILTLVASSVIFLCGECNRGHVESVRLDKGEFKSVVEAAAFKENKNISSRHKEVAFEIAFRESSLVTGAQNQRSTAFGLFQFLNKTWKTTGIEKSYCAVCQTRAFFRYVDDRYGSLEKALRHHDKHGWY